MESAGEPLVKRPLRKRTAADDAYDRYLQRLSRKLQLPPSLFTSQSLCPAELQPVGTSVLLAALRELATLEGQYHSIATIVEYLVTTRGMKPDAFLYECLIKANIDPRHGSAQIVDLLLTEMENNGIVPTAAVYHGILDVLAVHPDYVLRNRVLKDMKSAWVEPTFQGLVAVTVGLLRDGQYEMAMDSLETLHKSGIAIPTWLYEIFIYTFAELGMHEEVLMILQHCLRLDYEPISDNVWHAVLDAFSRDSHYEGTQYVWDRKVTNETILPPDGTVLNVLNTASSHGDSAMATSALKMLTQRGKKLGLHHFEPLLEIHAAEGDVKKTFLTLSLMAKAGLQPDASTTRPVYKLLKRKNEQVTTALKSLNEIRNSHPVPVAAFNVVLEAGFDYRGFRATLDMYRNIHDFCTSKPDLRTFELLLKHCKHLRSMQFVLAEMDAFSVTPNHWMCNRIITICTLNPEYDVAFRYIEEFRARQAGGDEGDWWLSRDTAMALIRRCLMAEDYRVADLIAECERRGMEDVQSSVRELVEKIQQQEEEKAAGELQPAAASSAPAAAIAEPTAPWEPQPEKARETSSG